MRLYEKVENVVRISAVVMALVVASTSARSNECSDALKHINYSMKMYNASHDVKYAKRAYMHTVDAKFACPAKYQDSIDDTRAMLIKKIK